MKKRFLPERCKFKNKCNRKNCPYFHTKEEKLFFRNRNEKFHFTSFCKFGNNCRDFNDKRGNKCTFIHEKRKDLRNCIKVKKVKNSDAGKIIKKNQEIEHMRKFLTEKVIENAKQEAANKLAQEELEALREKNRIMTEALEKVESKISRLESLRKK